MFRLSSHPAAFMWRRNGSTKTSFTSLGLGRNTPTTDRRLCSAPQAATLPLTSSARASSVDGISSPSALAVLRLSTSP
jgi:hypothetical protein